ncbi:MULTISPECIES: peptidylprolyl isomerase SurA [unclassified Agarivorans]|uniref:peptidylprolyl isomerase SurA n=1 Tax=unclassified Agarivorans TaxID=2636026 RepID=UPI0026E191D4|nr:MULTISPECIES: peptidylprolyl isomerase SurA [unclassified Agarivorans]MDO6688051.1 peptidylprolyl isomerase SurA [Agarivorans sp. 3_MG-2023]MDO6717630.1 peptidylprolyl isomerase SurA [Agarivorans sp. 2_MG-2023]
MKKLILLGVSMLMLNTGLVQAQEQLLDKVVVIVNNDVITESQIDELTNKVLRNATDSGQELPPEEELQEQVMDRLILESLQLQLADRLGIKISDSQLENTIDNIIAGEKKTREQFLDDLEKQNVSYNQFREDIRTEIVLGEVGRSQVQRRVNVSEQEIDALMKLIEEQDKGTVRYHVGHILLRLGSDETNTQQLAESLVQQLKDGENFNQLAMTHSQGPKALEGGDWGWMTIEEMPTLFAGVVRNQHQGSVLGPIRTDSGLHILMVLDAEGLQKVETLEVNARHILIKPSIILSDNKAQSLLAEFRQQLILGEVTFEELARQYSEDPGSAVRGGELGWSDPSVFVPAFRDTASRLEVGELSQPFRSTFGWHLLEVLDKRTTDTTNKASQNRAYQMIFNRKFNEETQAWQEELREEAYVEILDGEA